MSDLRFVAPQVSTILEASHVFKVGSGSLVDGYVTTTSFSGYLMIFDAASVPSDGAVTPLAAIVVASASTTALGFAPGYPVPFGSGLVFVFSTTGPFTKTASATAFFSARYI